MTFFLRKLGFFRRIGFLGVVLLAVSGCVSQKPALSPLQIPPEIKKLLVVSFRDMNKGKIDRVSIRCPLSGRVFAAGPVSPDAPAVMTTRLEKLLGNLEGMKVISEQNLWDIQSRMLDQGQEMSERSLMVETGKTLGADGVLVGHIYRYEDRVGGKYSVESPASVAFDLHLVRVSDGRVLWSDAFDETQKALTDDLFGLTTFLKRDGQWITADEMAAAGLEHLMGGMKQP